MISFARFALGSTRHLVLHARVRFVIDQSSATRSLARYYLSLLLSISCTCSLLLCVCVSVCVCVCLLLSLE